MNVQQIIDRVRAQFGDQSASQITDAFIMNWINDGMREIVLASDLLQTKGSTATVNGTSDYQLPDLLRLHAVKYNGRSLKYLTLQQAEELFPTKDDSSTFPVGEPEYYWMWGGRINLYPAPNTSLAAGLIIYYNSTPTEVANVNDTPVLPVAFHNRLVEYCIAQAAELDDDPAKYNSKMAEFKNNINDMKELSNFEQQDLYPFITDLSDNAAVGAYDAWGY